MNNTTLKIDFIRELKWRNQFNNSTPDAEKILNEEQVTGYIGFDPTSDSLHVGSLAQIITLLRFQAAGHKPIALVGGATGMIGDPSGKKEERKLLSEEEIRYNAEKIQKQLSEIFSHKNDASIEMVNNIDWIKNLSVIDFLRDIGKRFTVNYMLAKDSVKSRLETEISFTEFTYQILQAYDFYWLYTHKNCKLQMGGSDQWGNITAGIELIRKITGKEAHGITTNLITKADGTKFGKTESGNVWLDRHKTSPYKFYQFWLNISDEDVKNYIKIFTFLPKDEIENLIVQHDAAPHERILQKKLAQEVTSLVHSIKDYEDAKKASEILFNGSIQDIAQLSEDLFKDIMEGVPVFHVPYSVLENGVDIVDFLAVHTQIFPSKSEARKMIQSNAVSVNKQKVSDIKYQIGNQDVVNKKFILVQKGKKNYYLCYIEK
ncbi:MAG: tyrosine--tRNA ligase [Bacteroidetes bacterium]|nr:MAG: tyrosine--tRNA ligase [Bacteroidota bacterium]